MAQRAGIHPVIEALRAQKPLERVLIAKGTAGPRIQEIIDLCRAQAIPVRFEDRGVMDRIVPGTTHQGVIAQGAAGRYSELESVASGARMLVILDGVEDPHNLGAIVRTAHAAGVDAVIVPGRRAAGLTEAVSKAAAGALEFLPVARVTNIRRALESLKERGYWIYGVDERGAETYDRVEFTEPAAVVLGGEGKGLHQHIKQACDVLVRIPVAGRISSLNVSVAVGVVLFEWKRRRTAKTPLP